MVLFLFFIVLNISLHNPEFFSIISQIVNTTTLKGVVSYIKYVKSDGFNIVK